MKKIFVSFLMLVIFSGSALAVEYSAYEKKAFYDGFEGGMFYSLEQTLLQRGIPQAKTSKYVTALKGRLNRTQLENATWACVSKYTPQQLAASQKAVADECFAKWVDDFYGKNTDLINLLK